MVDLAAVMNSRGYHFNLPPNVMNNPKAREEWAKVGHSLKKVKVWYQKWVLDPGSGKPVYTNNQVEEMMAYVRKVAKSGAPEFDEMKLKPLSTLEKVIVNSTI